MTMTIPEFEVCFGTTLEQILMVLANSENHWLMAKFNANTMMPLQITNINRTQNTIELTPMLNSEQLAQHIKWFM